MNLFEYQKDIVTSLWKNRKTAAVICRQAGKTTVVAAFVCWYIIFNDHKTTAILATIALVIMVFFVVYTKMRVHELDTEHKQKYNDHFIKPAPRVTATQNPRWERIKQLFDSHNQNDWRVAIIDADTMLDELLISYNFPGENLGERLKNANNRVMPTVQSAWEAHKVRNRIAHEGANFSLSEREAQLVKKHYEFIFSDAGII